MARAPDKRIEQAKQMYLQGQKLVEIASQLNIPEGDSPKMEMHAQMGKRAFGYKKRTFEKEKKRRSAGEQKCDRAAWE